MLIVCAPLDFLLWDYVLRGWNGCGDSMCQGCGESVFVPGDVFLCQEDLNRSTGHTASSPPRPQALLQSLVRAALYHSPHGIGSGTISSPRLFGIRSMVWGRSTMFETLGSHKETSDCLALTPMNQDTVERFPQRRYLQQM
eukprot:2987348-Amphidinium_carterae.1